MEINFKYKPRDRVKNTLNGEIYYVVGVSYVLRNKRYNLTKNMKEINANPMMPGGTTYTADEKFLTLVESSDKPQFIPVDATLLGRGVTHKVTGIRGTITNVSVCPEGCIFCNVMYRKLNTKSYDLCAEGASIELLQFDPTDTINETYIPIISRSRLDVENTHKFKFMQLVRNKRITGDKFYRVIGYVDMIGSMRQYTVEVETSMQNPFESNGEMLEFRRGSSIDETELELVNTGSSHVNETAFDPITRFSIGDKVRITALDEPANVGVVTSISTMYLSDPSYTVMLTDVVKKESQKSISITIPDGNLLESVSEPHGELLEQLVDEVTRIDKTASTLQETVDTYHTNHNRTLKQSMTHLLGSIFGRRSKDAEETDTPLKEEVVVETKPNKSTTNVKKPDTTPKATNNNKNELRNQRLKKTGGYDTINPFTEENNPW